MAEFTQDNRIIAIETPLGKDVLLLRSFTGQEGISQLFKFQLDLLSEDSNIDFDKIVGQKVTVSLVLHDGTTKRYFNGYITRFIQLPGEGRLARYQAEMVPWLWFLTRTTDCAIYQNKKVPDIITEVFQKFGFLDFEQKLEQTYKPWENCVQYRETACNFVMRLMESEGIFFFFKHESGKHTLVMGDSPSAHRPVEPAQIRYESVAGQGFSRSEDIINNWRMEQGLRPGKYALNEYNFEIPSTSLKANVDTTHEQGGNSRYEIYDYPGEYEVKDESDTYTRLRMEEEETFQTMITGTSDCRQLLSGFRFDLTNHDRRDQNTTYVLTSVTHSADAGQNYTAQDQDDAYYANTFTCIQHAVPFRPARVTLKPLVQGCQTAVVVGKAGEEIWTDKYGRVKVQFHWDRYGKKDENSSCWIRVSSPWAGQGWGGISIPRIGQEVVVDFLEGDPDRPLIIGRVYNAEQMPPYGLPGGQVISGIKSNSTKGGGGYNEFVMDDTKSKELIRVHAQYDMDATVEHDDRQTVKNTRTINVTSTQTETVGGAVTETYNTNQRTTVNKEIIITSSTAHIHITAATEIKLEVGASKLLMKADGSIELKGINIAIDGAAKVRTHSAEITSEADAQHQIKGAIVVSEGSATNTVKGGMVMLNP